MISFPSICPRSYIYFHSSYQVPLPLGDYESKSPRHSFVAVLVFVLAIRHSKATAPTNHQCQNILYAQPRLTVCMISILPKTLEIAPRTGLRSLILRALTT